MLDWLQWPAMVVTLASTWLVGSQQRGRRLAGFALFLASNVLWVAWAWPAGAWGLVLMQAGLAAMNLRGAFKNEAKASFTAPEARAPRR